MTPVVRSICNTYDLAYELYSRDHLLGPNKGAPGHLLKVLFVT